MPAAHEAGVQEPPTSPRGINPIYGRRPFYIILCHGGHMSVVANTTYIHNCFEHFTLRKGVTPATHERWKRTNNAEPVGRQFKAEGTALHRNGGSVDSCP